VEIDSGLFHRWWPEGSEWSAVVTSAAPLGSAFNTDRFSSFASSDTVLESSGDVFAAVAEQSGNTAISPLLFSRTAPNKRTDLGHQLKAPLLGYLNSV